ncbi:hypothetical protein [Kallotenue papyrolyticum]|nr:hypothetical protein [Kallotenue papyrolyticum]
MTRTFRAAIKVGDDYVTIEESVCLPIGASEAVSRRAGWPR